MTAKTFRQKSQTISIEEISKEDWENYLWAFIEKTNYYDEISCGGFNTATFGPPFSVCSFCRESQFFGAPKKEVALAYAGVLKDSGYGHLGYRGIILGQEKRNILGRIIIKDLEEIDEGPEKANLALFRPYRGRGYYETVYFLHNIYLIWLQAQPAK